MTGDRRGEDAPAFFSHLGNDWWGLGVRSTFALLSGLVGSGEFGFPDPRPRGLDTSVLALAGNFAPDSLLDQNFTVGWPHEPSSSPPFAACEGDLRKVVAHHCWEIYRSSVIILHRKYIKRGVQGSSAVQGIFFPLELELELMPCIFCNQSFVSINHSIGTLIYSLTWYFEFSFKNYLCQLHYLFEHTCS